MKRESPKCIRNQYEVDHLQFCFQQYRKEKKIHLNMQQTHNTRTLYELDNFKIGK